MLDAEVEAISATTYWAAVQVALKLAVPPWNAFWLVVSSGNWTAMLMVWGSVAVHDAPVGGIVIAVPVGREEKAFAALCDVRELIEAQAPLPAPGVEPTETVGLPARLP